ncbi:hypothetical protein [Spiroplasma endosymbiont of Panorpa germanica]|uniref:hypothetical protein n=1 Tax=Spiroplasma endosymbiont of Panorpa germanica TaxID=3066314 RepID=UPI0030CC8023
MLKIKNQSLKTEFSKFCQENKISSINHKVAVDFINYLNLQNIKPDISDLDLISFICTSAWINKRDIVNQADLFVLKELDLPEEQISIILNAIQETMFFEINKNLNTNSDFKDMLIEALENKNIANISTKKIEELLIWINGQIKINKDLLLNIKNNDQLKSCFNQNDIQDFLTQWVLEKNKILRFQNYSFSLILEKIKSSN